MIDNREPIRSWWIFHPYIGLNITDEIPDLDESAMFGDATIISKEHKKQY